MRNILLAQMHALFEVLCVEPWCRMRLVLRVVTERAAHLAQGVRQPHPVGAV